MSPRPTIAIPARFSASASALRYQAEVAARALVEGVFRAGGEPLLVHPYAPDGEVDDESVAARLDRFDGVLLPGGGDLAPEWYAGSEHESLYDIDREQDAFDLAVAAWAWEAGRPLLAVCRGLQVVNVARGGTILTDMPTHHRHVVSELVLDDATMARSAIGQSHVRISCYHHQAVDQVGSGLRATARTSDGVIEAMERDTPGAWFLALQWHPEDTAATDPAQQAVFDSLVAAAGGDRHGHSIPNET